MVSCTERNDIESYIPIVYYLYKKLINKVPWYCEREDIVQSGMLGLVKAGRDFKADSCVPFEKYAYLKIRWELLNSLYGGMCPYPRRDIQRGSAGTWLAFAQDHDVPCDCEGLKSVEDKDMLEQVKLAADENQSHIINELSKGRTKRSIADDFGMSPDWVGDCIFKLRSMA